MNLENCMVIEDLIVGIRVVKVVGMISINVLDMKLFDDEIRELVFEICNNLFEVKEYLEIIQIYEKNNYGIWICNFFYVF